MGEARPGYHLGPVNTGRKLLIWWAVPGGEGVDAPSLLKKKRQGITQMK